MRSTVGRCVASVLLVATFGLGAVAGQSAPGPDKTGVGPTAVSLPSGAGSLTGFGAGYEWRVSGNKGAYRYEIAIAAPAGPAGLAPAVQLTYGSDLGAGIAGLGWRLDLPHIERDTSRRLPVYGGAEGRLVRVFGGREEVFRTEGGERLRRDDAGSYFAEHERSFVRYRREGGGWRAEYPDGRRLYLGVSSSSRLQSGDGSRVFRWLPERLVDPHGNEIAFTYAGDDEASAGAVPAKRLALIEYGAGAPPWRAAHVVRFEYEARPDRLLDGRPGFLVESAKRLRGIEVLSRDGSRSGSAGEALRDRNGGGIGERLVRGYGLEYAEPSAIGSVSLLSLVTEYGRDGVSALPGTSFAYSGQSAAPGVASGGLLTSRPNLAARVSSGAVELADVSGDALPDLLVTPAGFGAPHVAALNLGVSSSGGELRFAEPLRMGGVGRSRGVTLASSRQDATLGDYNGDGRVDLGYRSLGGRRFFFPGEGAAGWGARQRVGGGRTPRRFGGGGGRVRQADLDGDRRMDLVRTSLGGRQLSVWFCLETGGYSEEVVWQCPEGCDFRQAGTLLRDVTGDGLADLVWLGSGAVRVAPGLGFGRFAGVRRLFYPGRSSLRREDRLRARLVDVTGDGLSDLVVEPRAGRRLRVAVNRGGAELGPWVTVAGPPPVSAGASKTRWADMTGDGAVDYVRLEDAGGGPRVTVVDVLRALGAETKPNLLSRVDNGRGLVSEIAYTTAAAQMSAARAAGRPWRTRVPHAVVVVASVRETVYPQSAAEETRYVYRDGIYAEARHEYRGFETVDTVSVGEAGRHPTGVTRTRFERGDDHAGLQGLARLVTVMDGSGRLHSETETAWSRPPRALRFRSGEAVSHFAHPRRVVSRLYAADGSSPVTRQTRHVYDDAGNLVLAVEDGVVDASGAPVDPGMRRTRLAEYIVDESRWLLRAPRREAVRDAGGVVQSETLYYYDDEGFDPGRFGSISRGLLTMTRRRVSSGDGGPGALSSGGDWITDARHRYDGFGNRVLTAGALARVDAEGRFSASSGNWSRFAIDPVWRSRVVGETVVVDASTRLTHRVEYDRDFGLPTAHTEAAGARTRYAYDAFGRLSAIWHADDAPDLPSVRYRYAVGVEVPGGGRVSWVDSLLLDAPASADGGDGAYFVSRRFLDGKDRALYTKLEGGAGSAPGPAGAATGDAGAGSPGAVVTGVASFTRRAAAFETLMPCASPGAGDAFAWENPHDPSWRCSWLIDGSWRRYDFAEAPKTRRTYDAFGREVETRLPDGEVRRIRYRPLEQRMEDEKAVRGAASALTYEYDGFDRLAAMVEEPHLDAQGRPTGTRRRWRTTYGYDAADRLVSIRDSEGSERRARYDLLGRVVAVEHPGFGRLGFAYDGASRLVRGWDGAGRETAYDYDGAGRLRLVRSSLSPESGAGGGAVPSVVRYTYDVSRPGYLARVEDGLGVEELEYDARGRVTRTRRRLSPGLGGAELTVAERYDAMDRPVSRTFPDGDRLRFAYDARGQLSSLALDSVGVIAADAVYAPDEQLVSVGLGNGLTRTHAYDRRGRRRRTAIVRGGSSSLVFEESLRFDAASNIVGRERTLEAAHDVERFGYDELHRLVSATWRLPADGLARRADYRYSAAGDLLALEHDGVALPLEVARDASGRVVRTAQSELGWNSDGHLATVRHGGLRLDNLYDGGGRRVWSRTTDETSNAVVDTTLRPMAGYEIRNGGGTKQIAAFGGLLASVGAARPGSAGAVPEVFYYHPDHLGSPLLRFAADGSLLGRRRYGVYGELVEEDGFASVSAGFTGAPQERRFDLSVFEARAMAGATGRFLSPDPVLLHVGSPPLSPQALNPFSYAANRPLTHIDPDGRAWSLALTGVLALVDFVQWKTGNLSNEQFFAAMALNTAAGWADVASLGTGGGLAVRFGNLVVKSARRATEAERVAGVANVGYHVGQAVRDGDYGRATLVAGLGAATILAPRRVFNRSKSGNVVFPNPANALFKFNEHKITDSPAVYFATARDLAKGWRSGRYLAKFSEKEERLRVMDGKWLASFEWRPGTWFRPGQWDFVTMFPARNPKNYWRNQPGVLVEGWDVLKH